MSPLLPIATREHGRTVYLSGIRDHPMSIIILILCMFLIAFSSYPVIHPEVFCRSEQTSRRPYCCHSTTQTVSLRTIANLTCRTEFFWIHLPKRHAKVNAATIQRVIVFILFVKPPVEDCAMHLQICKYLLIGRYVTE